MADIYTRMISSSKGDLHRLNKYVPSSTTLPKSIARSLPTMSRTLNGQNGLPLSIAGASSTALSPVSPISSMQAATTVINNVTANGVVGNRNDLVTWIENKLSQRINRSGNLSTIRTGGRASG